MRFLSLVILINVYINCVVSQSIDDFKVSSIISLIESKKMTCFEITTYFLERCVKYNPSIRAIISYNPNALKRAHELDEYFNKNGKLNGKLHCVPFLIKDNIDIENIPTTGGINALRNLIPRKSALVVERLANEGAVFIAKTNLAELALGFNYSSETGGECVNPFDHKRTCGRSSSGSGAGISAAMGIVSLGTDTMASIYNPSSYNGLFGLRPPTGQYELLDGIIPILELHDTVGPMAKHLDDVVLTYSIITNNTSIYDQYKEPLPAKGLKLRIITNFMNSFKSEDFDYKIEPKISRLIKNAWKSFKTLGLNISERTLSKDELHKFIKSLSMMTLNSSKEYFFSTFIQSMDNYLSNPKRFGPDSPYRNVNDIVRSPLLSDRFRALLGYDDSEDYDNFYDSSMDQLNGHLNLVNKFKHSLREYFVDGIDAILIPAWITDVPYLEESKDKSLGMISVFGGLGLLTIPAGFTSPTKESPNGLPFGMALLGMPDKMVNLFKIAKFYENKYNHVKLPHSTPLIKKKKCLTK